MLNFILMCEKMGVYASKVCFFWIGFNVRGKCGVYRRVRVMGGRRGVGRGGEIGVI